MRMTVLEGTVVVVTSVEDGSENLPKKGIVTLRCEPTGCTPTAERSGANFSCYYYLEKVFDSTVAAAMSAEDGTENLPNKGIVTLRCEPAGSTPTMATYNTASASCTTPEKAAESTLAVVTSVEDNLENLPRKGIVTLGCTRWLYPC